MARNVDGTTNKMGTINSYVDLTMEIDRRTTDTQLLVMGLGSQKIILGFPWLNEHNPDINWKTGTFKWRTFQPLKVKRYHNQPTYSITQLGQSKRTTTWRLNYIRTRHKYPRGDPRTLQDTTCIAQKIPLFQLTGKPRLTPKFPSPPHPVLTDESPLGADWLPRI